MEVFNASFEQRKVNLSAEQEHHLNLCGYCTCCFPVWKLKESGLIPIATRIVSDARLGHAEILHKQSGEFEVYFKPNERDSTFGILVKTTSKGELVLAEEAPVERFLAQT